MITLTNVVDLGYSQEYESKIFLCDALEESFTFLDLKTVFDAKYPTLVFDGFKGESKQGKDSLVLFYLTIPEYQKYLGEQKQQVKDNRKKEEEALEEGEKDVDELITMIRKLWKRVDVSSLQRIEEEEKTLQQKIANLPK
jgi:hypothetical protein